MRVNWKFIKREKSQFEDSIIVEIEKLMTKYLTILTEILTVSVNFLLLLYFRSH